MPVVNPNDLIELRECQKQSVDRGLAAVSRGQKIFIENLAPGAGKSLSGLCLADQLMAVHQIDTLVWLAPRKNLCEQVSSDWLEYRDRLPWARTMRDLDWRENAPPLIRGKADGYITTYASVMANLNLHLDTLRGRRVMLILDEAQQLGVPAKYAGITEDDHNQRFKDYATISAQACHTLGADRVLIVLLTGTAERPDGSPLLFAEDHYSPPDSTGWSKLNADVEVTYSQGVAQRFLRPYQADLWEGQIDWHEIGEPTIQLRTTEMDKEVWRALQDEQYRNGLIDRWVDRLRDQQATVSPVMAGILVGYRIKEVKEMASYLKKRHGNLRFEVVTSDEGEEAVRRLKRVREAQPDDRDFVDGLLTINMAYIGFDWKRAAVLGLLTAYRTDSYLDQVSARCMRMLPGIDPDLQWCHLIAPDDPKMRRWSERKRQESEAGMYIRLPKPPPPPPPPPVQEKLGWADNGQIIGITARGFYEKGDIDEQAEYHTFEELRKKYAVASPVTQIKALVTDYMNTKIKPEMPIPNSSEAHKSNPEQERELRKSISEDLVKCDRAWHSPLDKPRWGDTAKILASLYDWILLDAADVKGLQARRKTLTRWMEQGYIDEKRDDGL